MSGVNFASSSSTASTHAGASSIYVQLLRTYQAAKANSNEEARTQLALLPETMRNQIYGLNFNLEISSSNQNVKWDQTNLFDSLPRLQQSIQQVACNTFNALRRKQKKYVIGRVKTLSGYPEMRALCIEKDVEALLKSLDDCLSSELTPNLRVILNSWVKEGTPEEKRKLAKRRIIDFLNDRTRDTLDLSWFQLSTLPPIFNTDPFINRLMDLILCENQLTELPKEIGQLQVLQNLSVNNNQLTELPEEIGQLQMLKTLSVNQNWLTKLPGAISKLQKLYYLDISENPLFTAISKEMLTLPHTCTIILNGTCFSDTVFEELSATSGNNRPSINLSKEDCVNSLEAHELYKDIINGTFINIDKNDGNSNRIFALFKQLLNTQIGIKLIKKIKETSAGKHPILIKSDIKSCAFQDLRKISISFAPKNFIVQDNTINETRVEQCSVIMVHFFHELVHILDSEQKTNEHIVVNYHPAFDNLSEHRTIEGGVCGFSENLFRKELGLKERVNHLGSFFGPFSQELVKDEKTAIQALVDYASVGASFDLKQIMQHLSSEKIAQSEALKKAIQWEHWSIASLILTAGQNNWKIMTLQEALQPIIDKENPEIAALILIEKGWSPKVLSALEKAAAQKKPEQAAFMLAVVQNCQTQ